MKKVIMNVVSMSNKYYKSSITFTIGDMKIHPMKNFVELLVILYQKGDSQISYNEAVYD
jgi:hypothetical protein